MRCLQSPDFQQATEDDGRARIFFYRPGSVSESREIAFEPDWERIVFWVDLLNAYSVLEMVGLLVVGDCLCFKGALFRGIDLANLS